MRMFCSISIIYLISMDGGGGTGWLVGWLVGRAIKSLQER